MCDCIAFCGWLWLGSADGAGEMDRMCSKLAKLIAVAGLVALQQLIYMEGSVLTELKHHTAWHGADGIQVRRACGSSHMHMQRKAQLHRQTHTAMLLDTYDVMTYTSRKSPQSFIKL